MTDQQTQTRPQENGEESRARELGARPSAALCPYCGHISRNTARCDACKGVFEPLSRQATQNAMGPWQVRDPDRAFLPGCSYEQIRQLVKRGKVQRQSVVRGPTTRQFWSFACNTPGVAVLLGECHACHRRVDEGGYMCPGCGAVLAPRVDRQSLGLSPVMPLPGEAPAPEVARASIQSTYEAPAVSRPVEPAALRPPESTDAGAGLTRGVFGGVSALERSGSERGAPEAEITERLRRSEMIRRRQQRRLVVFQVASAALAVACVALAGLLVFVGAGGSLPATAEQGRAIEERPAAATPDPEPKASIADRYAEELTEARTLSEQGSIPELIEARSILRDVRDRAREDGLAGVSELEAEIGDLSERIDQLKLRELLGTGAETSAPDAAREG